MFAPPVGEKLQREGLDPPGATPHRTGIESVASTWRQPSECDTPGSFSRRRGSGAALRSTPIDSDATVDASSVRITHGDANEMSRCPQNRHSRRRSERTSQFTNADACDARQKDPHALLFITHLVDVTRAPTLLTSSGEVGYLCAQPGAFRTLRIAGTRPKNRIEVEWRHAQH